MGAPPLIRVAPIDTTQSMVIKNNKSIMYKRKNHETEKQFEVQIVPIPIPVVETSLSKMREINEKQNYQPQYSGDIVDQSYSDILSIRKQLKTVKQQTDELENQEKKLGENKKTLLDIDKSKKPQDDVNDSSK